MGEVDVMAGTFSCAGKTSQPEKPRALDVEKAEFLTCKKDDFCITVSGLAGLGEQ